MSSNIYGSESQKELLEKLNNEFEAKHAKSIQLLENIRSSRDQIEKQLQHFKSEEPDLIYRFYHQSYKVFYMVPLIERADTLFRHLAPDGVDINSWYSLIAKGGLGRKFNPETSNANWLTEVPPMLMAFWNAKYFLEQMLVAADELDEAPQVLPSGWAAILYLYGLR
jgi:hypothetical protein